jgi:tellurite resistance protein TerC
MGPMLTDTPILVAQARPPGADLVVPGGWWVALAVLVVALVLIDLLVVNRRTHEIGVHEALVSSGVWIGIGLAFGVAVWVGLGGDAGGQYFAGYLIEKSLSVDNVFVWAVILTFFAVPGANQHRVLFWGIFGALAMRAVFIWAGVALLDRLSWIVLIFGGFLLYTGVRVATHGGEQVHPERNPVLRFVRRHIEMTDDYHEAHFFIRRAGELVATPMFAVLVLIEATDVLFAIDSIPAVLAVSRSPFIVYSSNAFAILGLRALYFVLAGFKDRLVHLNKGLGVILVYVGIKMLLSFWDVHLPVWLSLGIIVVILAVTVALSLRAKPEEHAEPEGERPRPPGPQG